MGQHTIPPHLDYNRRPVIEGKAVLARMTQQHLLEDLVPRLRLA
jgi:hypothetical protein